MKIITKKDIKRLETALKCQKENIVDSYTLGLYNGILLVYSEIMSIDYEPIGLDKKPVRNKGHIFSF